ncbi:general stress protein [Serinicoccus chungangensis]|uniref:general stress protein n=1 Tax=Serinicoccus chungangensis TaxID=767452 RepID=UPI00111AED31|nr:general stress protein [Serinicoccus chungangensis]
MTTPTGSRAALPRPTLDLDYPQSLGVFERYEQAQEAVDYLSDHEFPVDQVLIVGTELKQVERVTGRLTTGRVALGGALSGVWLGLFVGLIFALFAGPRDALMTVIWTACFGAVFGLVWGLIGYAFTRGRRDFTSVTQVVATRYEVLTEHKLRERARELLDGRST